jgi:hypothetical protein
MSTDLLHIGVDCSLLLIAVIGLVTILNRLGFHAWVRRASRDKQKTQDSSAERYWSAQE